MFLRREGRRAAQAEIPQAQPRSRQLSVISGRVLRGGLVERLGLFVLTHRLRGAPLPIACAREGVRTFRSLRNTRKMRGSGLRIVQVAQRHPAGSEMRIDPEETFHGRGGIARHAIGGMRVAVVEQLAHQQAAFHPPLIEVDQFFGILRRGEDQLAGLFRLVVQTQPLHTRENIASVALR